MWRRRDFSSRFSWSGVGQRFKVRYVVKGIFVQLAKVSDGIQTTFSMFAKKEKS